MNIYNYVFYKIHWAMARVNREMPVFASVMFMCWLEYFIFTGIYVFTLPYLPWKIDMSSKLTSITLGLVILCLNWMYFRRQGFVNSIIERYDLQKRSSQIIGSILVYGSIIVIFYLWFTEVIPEMVEIGKKKKAGII